MSSQKKKDAPKHKVSLLSALLPTKKMNMLVSAHLCAILLVTNSSLPINLGCPYLDYHSASRSKVKPRKQMAFIGKLCGVYVCVCMCIGVGVVFRYLISSVSVWVLQEADAR